MFSITADFDRAERILSDLGRRQLPFAAAQALNDTGADVLDAIELEIATTFDRPTRFTKKAFRLHRASKTNLRAQVLRKDAVASRHYLEVQERGGVRPQTGLETLMASRLKYGGIVQSVIPAKGARLNAYGNWSPGQRNQVLSSIKSQRDPRTNTAKRNSRRARNKVGQYFVPREGSKLSPGVYQRMARNRVKKIVHITDSAARYRARFRFHERAERRARLVFEGHLVRRLRQAIATAK